MNTSEESLLQAIDLAYFQRLRDIPIDVLGGVRPSIDSESKARFMSGEQDSPGFSFDHIDLDYLETKKHDLMLLLKDVQEDDSFPESAKKLYIAVFSERLNLLSLLQATAAMDRSSDVSEQAESAAIFMSATASVYGMPEKGMFAAVLGKVLKKTVVKKGDSGALLCAKQELGSFIERSPLRPVTTPVLPGRAVEHGDAITDASKIKQIFEESLIERGLVDWSVEIDDTGDLASVMVLTKSKRLMVPCTEQIRQRPASRSLTPERIQGLVAHEIETHAVRAHRGERSRLMLLSLGLAGYISGEEGLATYREKLKSGGGGFAGLDGYLAAGLAAGLDRDRGRTFRELYDLLFLYYQVSNKCSKEQASQHAWQRCVRTFRGTPGSIPGVFFTRDIVYRRGSVLVYDFMKTPESSSLDLDAGKYDPTNVEHVSRLQDLGIL